MKISVILPLCKPEKQLSRAIGHVLAQDFNDRFELIVVVDFLSEAHRRMLSAYHDDSRVRVLYTSGGEGLPSSLHMALTHADGKYITRMDAGVVMSKDMLRKTFEQHERSGQEIAFVGSKRYWISYSGKPYCKISEEDETYRLENLEDLIQRRQVFTDAGVMFRKSLALAVGGYNAFSAHAADMDLWLRMMEYSGKPCLTLHELLIGKHLMPGSVIFDPCMNLDTSIVREYARHRQQMRLPVNHQPDPGWLANMRTEMEEQILQKKRVHMPVDIAMINLWLKDYRGCIAFLRLAFSRNLFHASWILLRHWFFGWYHDFIEGERVVLTS
jgi:glycosyltransferase involved in cell wall biosynthesis